MEKKFKILLAYLFGWLSGLIIYFVEQDPEVKRHAAQSIIIFGSLAILSFLFGILAGILPFAGLVVFLINLVSFIIWIYFLYASITENYKIFEFVEPLVNKMVKQ